MAMRWMVSFSSRSRSSWIPAPSLVTVKFWLRVSIWMSSLSLDTSIPTQTRVRAATGSMVKSLSCRCALVHGAASRRPLCRLFGLIPCKRRRSCSVTVSEDSGTIDLAPLVAVPGATLRFAPGTATPSIEPCFWFLGNIQDYRGLRDFFYEPRNSPLDRLGAGEKHARDSTRRHAERAYYRCALATFF